MRIGASIILLDGYCFQSYQWKFFRPLGSLQNILKFLDLYDVDEICITRPIKQNDSESSLCNDLQLIRSLLSNSPISFGGGLRNPTALKLLHNLPVERLHFSSAFINHDVNIIKQAANLFGKQAIVATLPIKIIDDNLFVYNGGSNSFQPLSEDILNFIAEHADEAMIVDVMNEGIGESFNFKILDLVKFPKNQLIISGGIGPNVIKTASNKGIASCLIENRVLHHENYIKSEI
jgi:phosphoribosylformimino-5-aminoimidazole carboxamide ribonucleotide (ProFAR) isomerase